MRTRLGKGAGWWLWLAFVSLSLPVAMGIADLSLPFGLDSSLTKSRFSTYVGPKARDIRVYVMKNISEDTPIGTVLDTFKAHDPMLPMYNFT